MIDGSVMMRNDEQCSRLIYLSFRVDFSLPASVELPTISALDPVDLRLV